MAIVSTTTSVTQSVIDFTTKEDYAKALVDAASPPVQYPDFGTGEGDNVTIKVIDIDTGNVINTLNGNMALRVEVTNNE